MVRNLPPLSFLLLVVVFSCFSGLAPPVQRRTNAKRSCSSPRAFQSVPNPVQGALQLGIGRQCPPSCFSCQCRDSYSIPRVFQPLPSSAQGVCNWATANSALLAVFLSVPGSLLESTSLSVSANSKHWLRDSCCLASSGSSTCCRKSSELPPFDMVSNDRR